jgi:threonine synthase
VATGLLDDVVYDWRALVHDMLLGPAPGGPVVATEADVVDAHALVLAHTEVPADPTGTAGLAGLLAARRDGCIDAAEEVVVLLTGLDRS